MTVVPATPDYDDDASDFEAPCAVLSMRASIDNLGVGESFARAARFDPDLTSKQTLHTASRGMRFSTQPTVFRIRQRTKKTYTIEQGEIRTDSRDIILVIVVTRLT